MKTPSGQGQCNYWLFYLINSHIFPFFFWERPLSSYHTEVNLPTHKNRQRRPCFWTEEKASPKAQYFQFLQFKDLKKVFLGLLRETTWLTTHKKANQRYQYIAMHCLKWPSTPLSIQLRIQIRPQVDIYQVSFWCIFNFLLVLYKWWKITTWIIFVWCDKNYQIIKLLRNVRWEWNMFCLIVKWKSEPKLGNSDCELESFKRLKLENDQT